MRREKRPIYQKTTPLMKGFLAPSHSHPERDKEKGK
jgi:hypothetical protein